MVSAQSGSVLSRRVRLRLPPSSNPAHQPVDTLIAPGQTDGVGNYTLIGFAGGSPFPIVGRAAIPTPFRCMSLAVFRRAQVSARPGIATRPRSLKDQNLLYFIFDQNVSHPREFPRRVPVAGSDDYRLAGLRDR